MGHSWSVGRARASVPPRRAASRPSPMRRRTARGSHGVVGYSPDGRQRRSSSERDSLSEPVEPRKGGRRRAGTEGPGGLLLGDRPGDEAEFPPPPPPPPFPLDDGWLPMMYVCV